VKAKQRWGRAGAALVALVLIATACAQRPQATALRRLDATVQLDSRVGDPVGGPIIGPATTLPATTTTTSNPPPTSSLVIEPTTESRLTDNFNPFDRASPLTQMGVPFYTYEPLVEYNELQVDQYYPWLAESWSFSTSGQTVTFDLRPGVRFDDGSALTAADVAYTFNLLRTYPRLGYGIPIVSAVATNPTTFTLTLSQAGYAFLYEISRVPIVKAGYAAGTDPGGYVDKSPDGTGPYVLASAANATSRRVVLTRRSDYWQRGEPAIQQLVFPAYRDGAEVQAALQAGTLDWAANFMPGVERGFVDRDRTDNHYWFPTVSCISLELNLARAPTDNLAVRQAISDAINRDALSQETTDGYDPPATTTSGLVLPTDKQFLTSSDTGDIDDTGDPAATDSLLALAGYHRVQGHWADASGQPLELNIEDPRGTSLAAAASVVANQLHAAGFDARASTVSFSRWLSDLARGHFTGSVLASASGPSPFYMYENWLDPALVVHGRANGGNYEQLDAATDPAAAALVSAELDAFTDNPSDSAAAQSAVEKLADVVTQQAPVLPLMYGVAWAEFSTRHATGWPDSQDPYEPGIPAAPFAEYTVLQLAPSSP
jgi:peptide/nickel transport system substrate-binding protein